MNYSHLHWGTMSRKARPNPLFGFIDLQGDAELIELAKEHDYRVHLAACLCMITLEALIEQLSTID